MLTLRPLSLLLLLVLSGGSCTSEAERAAEHVRIVLFIQGDFSARNVCDRGKLQNMWGEDGLITRTVDELLSYRANLHRSGDSISVVVYAMNADVTPLGAFSDLSASWKNPSSLGTEVGRRGARNDLVLRLSTAYRGAIRSQVEGELKHTRQDITRAVLLLLNARAEFFSSSTDRVAIIFVSDMLHYNTDGATDASRNRFSFVDPYSRELFQRSVYGGTLPPNVSLTPIADSVEFDVISIRVPRCADEVWADGKVHDFPAIDREVETIWTTVFERLGADRIELGRVSPRGMFTR